MYIMFIALCVLFVWVAFLSFLYIYFYVSQCAIHMYIIAVCGNRIYFNIIMMIIMFLE